MILTQNNRKSFSSNGAASVCLLWHSKVKKRQFGRRTFTSGRDNPHCRERTCHQRDINQTVKEQLGGLCFIPLSTQWSSEILGKNFFHKETNKKKRVKLNYRIHTWDEIRNHCNILASVVMRVK